MPQVTVTIAGRAYRMACDEGQEEHLLELGKTLDSKIETIRSNFGEIGDMRMAVMAGIMLADELAETHRKLEAARSELAERHANTDSLSQHYAEQEQEAVQSLGKIADRIEKVAGEINQRLRRTETTVTN